MKIGILGIFVLFPSLIFGQNIDDFYHQLTQKNINKNFPKKIVYDGPQLPLNIDEYNRLGFSYVSVYSLVNSREVPNSKKYILWTGVAFDYPNSNWSKSLTPFGNNLNEYEKTWNTNLKSFHEKYSNPKDKSKYGMIVLDIEAKKTADQLKQSPPYQKGRTRSAKEAIADYKIAMADLYNKPLEYAKKKHDNYMLWSSFGDVPIELTWWGIPLTSWSKWTTNPTLLNYTTHKLINGKPYETDFFENLDFLSVSSYYIYNPLFSNKQWASQYLAYMLFQIESNMEWTKKPIYVYHWFKYQGQKERGTLISEDMVKNSVIFAFMSGAEGMVLYDDSRKVTNDKNYHNLIKTFIESISLLNKYNDYFTNGNVSFYRPDTPTNLFINHRPVIRGIKKNNKLLLAVTNPFARKDEITNLSINFEGKLISIRLKGNETYLNEIIL